ncbi:MAG: proton-conducting transporter membrane subunit, partial [Bdellovibrio sp.]
MAYSNFFVLWTVTFLILGPLSFWLLRGPRFLWGPLFLTPFLGVLYESFRALTPRQDVAIASASFFAILLGFIGALVCFYSMYYFTLPQQKKFFPFFFLFSGSMLGVLLSDNIFIFYMFWELTSLTSFLLIGFDFSQNTARKAARQALIVSVAGGLCLLAALLLLNLHTGSFSISEIINFKGTLPNKTTIMILLILAAMTKSAQFPFHFWLPEAMTAPTPASCFLHSATMVKLGVYLLITVSPLFIGDLTWTVFLCAIGIVTL